MATCIDLAGVKYPADKIPLEGRSLAPAFSGSPISASPRPLFWEHEGNRAVRNGKWELVA